MRQWAISVGINQYQFFQPLSYAQHDAQAIQQFLIDDGHVPDEQCLLLTETSPSQWGKSTYPDRLVRRAQLSLGAARGENNRALSTQRDLSRKQVQVWRGRWQAASQSLLQAESEDISEGQLQQRIEGVLQDEQRSGSGEKFQFKGFPEVD